MGELILVKTSICSFCNYSFSFQFLDGGTCESCRKKLSNSFKQERKRMSNSTNKLYLVTIEWDTAFTIYSFWLTRTEAENEIKRLFKTLEDYLVPMLEIREVPLGQASDRVILS